jgi:transketolase
MRKHFAKIINEYAKLREDIFLITGDLGYGVLDEYRKINNKKFLNIGICEQSMMSFAAGFSSNFKNTFVYSIANFNIFRGAEQIRNDICYQNNKVIITSVGTGFSYGKLGYTHYGIEDIGLINSFPNILIYNPLDEFQLQKIFPIILKEKKPIYLRLNRDIDFSLNKKREFDNSGFEKIFFKTNNKITFLSFGYTTKIIFKYLKKMKIIDNVNLIDCYKLKPFNRKKLIPLIRDSKKIIIVEEHISSNGLKSIFLENMHDLIKGIEVESIGIDNQNFYNYGDHDFMIKKYINIHRKIERFL